MLRDRAPLWHRLNASRMTDRCAKLVCSRLMTIVTRLATPERWDDVDADALKAEHVSGSALFTGTMRTFIAAGFKEIDRTYPSRPVMRHDL